MRNATAISCVLATVSLIAGQADGANIAVSTSTTYQTMLGWGLATELTMASQTTPALRDEIIKELVDDFGLTRIRAELPHGNFAGERSWEWVNDDNNPEHINWAAFNTEGLDRKCTEVLLPFKQRVEARGERMCVYLSHSFFDGGSTGPVPPWLFNSPGEYAEFYVSAMTYLRDTHNVQTDFCVVVNEPTNQNAFTASVVANLGKTLGAQMAKAGLTTRIQFAEGIDPATTWNFIQSTQSDAALWAYVGCISYHLYGTADPQRRSIGDFARSAGIPSAQTEYTALDNNHLYTDLTDGNCSYWEVYSPHATGAVLAQNRHRLEHINNYWNFRQLTHYVRKGSVRVGAQSGSSSVRTLAFVKNAKVTVAMINTGATESSTISGLPAGQYGVCQSVNRAAYQELGVQTVGAAGTLSLSVTGNAVVTVYPYAGANQPPTITTWGASADHLLQPSSSVTLSATATDPELAALTYAWTLKSAPGGASVAIASPNSASTQASGLSAPGEYVFGLTVSDGALQTTKDIRTTVFASNQHPYSYEVHNRLPVLVTLPQSGTTVRSKPGVDLEGDAISYQWRLISQPATAAAVLTDPNTNSCTVTNMTVAGDYKFEYRIIDAGGFVPETLTVPVYPVNQTAPAISSASAPDDTLWGVNAAALTAVTGDADGDMISHWWYVKSAPAGATPVLVTPGAAATNATGLTVQGRYTFTLIVVDRTRVTTRDVSVYIANPSTGLARATLSNAPTSFAIAGIRRAPGAAGWSVRFAVPATIGSDASRVTLEAFDMRGRLAATVANGLYAPGVHEVAWSGGSAHSPGSGPFVVRLTANGFTQSRAIAALR